MPLVMLQRIQSVYLFLVVIFGVLFFFFPLGLFTLESGSAAIKLIGRNLSPENIQAEYAGLFRWTLKGTGLVCIFLAMFTIFQFRSRLYQVKLCRFNILLHLVLLVVSFFYLDQLKASLSQLSFAYGPSIFFPLASLFLLLLAIRSINRDEALVRAADRIR
jgi:hypothetical protein